MSGKLTDVAGLLVGHWTCEAALTGCTAILLPPGSTGSVVVSGSAPATRGTRLLDPQSWVSEVHALVFSGGSAYGLDCVGGVMRFLESRGVGHKTSSGIVPIVAAAAIYDLNRGDPSIRPGPDEGFHAASVAAGSFATGPVGAGTGATCSKYLGIEKALPSGLGTSSISVEDLVVGALAVVNPVGDIIDEHGKVLLGHGAPEQKSSTLSPIQNTVLVAVAANCRLSKLECFQAASRIQDGIARAIYPSRTKHDGDAGFFLSCGPLQPNIDLLFKLVADVSAAAIRAVSSTAPPK